MVSERSRILFAALKKVCKINKEVHGWSSNGWSHFLTEDEVYELLGIPDIDELMDGDESVINLPAIPEMSIADFAKSAGCKVIIKKEDSSRYKAFFEHPEHGEISYTPDKNMVSRLKEYGYTPILAVTNLCERLNIERGGFITHGLGSEVYIPIPKYIVFTPSKIVFEPVEKSGVHTTITIVDGTIKDTPSGILLNQYGVNVLGTDHLIESASNKAAICKSDCPVCNVPTITIDGKEFKSVDTVAVDVPDLPVKIINSPPTEQEQEQADRINYFKARAEENERLKVEPTRRQGLKW